MQDSQVNLSVEAKGRSSSIALNRVVAQTSMDIVGRELYPKAFHVPTWSLLADQPSRDRAVERPRLRWPAWLFDLVSGDEGRVALAIQDLDALPTCSKAELKWVMVVLALAERLGVLFGRGDRSSPASEWTSGPRGDPSGAGRSDHSGAAAGARDGARQVHPAADGDGEPREFGAPGLAAPLDAGPRVWFLALRDAAASRRSSGCPVGRAGSLWVRASRTGGELARRADLGEAGTERGADTFTALGASCVQGHSVGLELAADSTAATLGLLLFVETGGALVLASKRYFDEHHRSGNRVVAAVGARVKLVAHGAKPVRETRHAAHLRVLRPFRQQHESFASFVAGQSAGICGAIAASHQSGDDSPGTLHAWLASNGRSHVPVHRLG